MTMAATEDDSTEGDSTEVTAQVQAARDSVTGTLRDMNDGFLMVADDWRIIFVNKEAERLLDPGPGSGPGPGLLGSVLWDIPAVRVSGLEGQCRLATAKGRAIGFDLHWPTDQRLYQARLVPVPGRGLTIYFVDVTDQRRRIAERTAEWIAVERATRIGELTSALAEALTSKDVVQVVAERVLPPFGADGLVVQVLEGDRVYAIDAVGYSQEFLNQIYELPLASEVVLLDVLGNRVPRFVESTAEFIRIYPMMEELTSTSTKNAWAFLPLIASGHAIGCCTVSFTQPRSFSDEERTLLTALSGLVAQALERARLYDREHLRAQELQRGLLPRTLPSLPAVSAAARYLPAGKGEEVGGDWYDLIPLSADRVAMVVGDVMGHGIAEAATMGQLRTAVRTLADLEMDPGEVLGHLNDLVSDLGDDYYATCLYAVFDPVTRICSFALAGHPPPLVVHADGTIHCPHPAADPPLGAAEPPFGTHELHLPEESLLVFCTDGLVESATRDIEQGLDQLKQTLSQAVVLNSYFPAGPQDSGAGGIGRLEDLCEIILSALLPDREQTNDDAALLIARIRCTATADIASCSLPEDPRAAGQAREYVRKQLAVWGLDDLVLTTELLVSELVGNVIRHAKGPIRLRLLRSRSLTCEVYDSSLTTPRIRRAEYTDEGGRGLHLVAALSQRWGTRYLDTGKCIWTEQEALIRE